MSFWLMKSEPDTFSIDDLKNQKTTWWDGVRNYQARNFMMNDMKVGDKVVFYHSNAEPPGVAGIASVSKLAQPDETAFDKKSDYFEPKATREKPIWFSVQIKFNKKFSRLISLLELRQNPKLKDMLLLKKGQRLSVQPLSELEYHDILEMNGQD